MQKTLNKIIIIIFFLITACASSWEDVKEGLGGKKRTSSDEFLVKKKDPLVMPPKWKDLPQPGQNMKLDGDDEVTDIEELIQQDKDQKSSTNHGQGSDSLEESLLKKINQK